MTVERLQAAFQRALSRPKITTRDVEAFRRAVKDRGEVTPEELSTLKLLAEQHKSRFDPSAARRIATMLTTLQATPAPRPPPVVQPEPQPPVQPEPQPPVQPEPQPPIQPEPQPPTVVSWDTFTVSTTRDGLTGTQVDEGRSTFDKLEPAVTAGALSKGDQLLLSSSASRIGVMGEAQALRSVALLQQLSPADAARFRDIASKTASPLERAFVFKALAAGHTLDDLASFQSAIQGWDNAKLLSTLNLADPITDDGTQTGVKQQHQASCVPTTGQALRGEVDPIYALQVRTENTNINAVDNTNAFAINPKLAQEQADVLTSVAGRPTPRNQAGWGTNWSKLDLVYNARSAQTGYVFSTVQFDQRPDLTLDAALDLLAAQLNQGIPTPLLVGVQWAPKCHAMIALEAQGTGPDQRFLIHDPWAGNTMWVTRAEFLVGNAPMGEFKVIGGFHLATPAPPVAPVVTPTPPTTPTPSPAPTGGGR